MSAEKMTSNDLEFEEVFNPDWDTSLSDKSIEEEQSRYKQSEIEKNKKIYAAIEAKQKEDARRRAIEVEEKKRGSPSVNTTKLTTEDGSPVVLVQQVVRDENFNTPGNVAKRLGRRATSAIGFVVGAVIVSVIASVIVNRMNGQIGGPIDSLVRAIFGS